MTTTAEPTTRVGGRWIALLSLANLGLWMGYFGPLQVLLPNQAEDVAGDGKTTALAIITGFGALVAVIAGPVAGALSDATTARTGRRHTWIVAGAAVGVLGLLLLPGRDSVLTLTLAWCLAQAGLNALQAGLTAIVPDRTPVGQRGLVSGWVGLTQSVGVVAGVLLVTVVGGGYALIAAVVLLSALPFVLTTPDPPPATPDPPPATDPPSATPDPPSATDPPPVTQDPPPGAPGAALRAAAPAAAGPGERAVRPFALAGSVADFARPLRDHDFAWAFVTRFLVQLGNAMATLYLLYFLRDEVGHADAEDGLAVLIVVYTVATVLTVVVGGVVSDRSGRRKPSVILSGYVMAFAAALLAFWPTWTGSLVAAFVLGLGFGVYLSVDQALITQVLPSANDRARDLGIINIANSAPQVLGPAVAFPLVEYLGGYPVLHLGVAAVTVLGSVLVTRIRAVR